MAKHTIRKEELGECLEIETTLAYCSKDKKKLVLISHLEKGALEYIISHPINAGTYNNIDDAIEAYNKIG